MIKAIPPKLSLSAMNRMLPSRVPHVYQINSPVEQNFRSTRHPNSATIRTTHKGLFARLIVVRTASGRFTSLILQILENDARRLIQTVDEADLAYSVLRNVELRSIRMIHCEAKLTRTPVESTRPLKTDLDAPIGRYHGVKDQTLQTAAHFRVCNEVTTGSVRTLFDITLAFEVEYSVLRGYQPTESQLTAFAQAFAVYNAWPYARETFQNLVTRMGECPPPLPLLRFSPPTPTLPTPTIPTPAMQP
jgi:hypothetical protein